MASDPLPVTAEIIGDERLKATMAAAGKVILTDRDKPGQKAGNIAASRARSTAPKVTGALAASGTVVRRSNGASVVFTKPYANPVHWGWAARGIAPNPWASLAAQQTEPEWARVFEDWADDTLSDIKGA